MLNSLARIVVMSIWGAMGLGVAVVCLTEPGAIVGLMGYGCATPAVVAEVDCMGDPREGV